MRNHVIGVTAAIVAIAAGVALATVNEPAQAKKVQGDVGTAYEECTTPNALFASEIPACSPPTRSDTQCGFGAGGKGSVQLKLKKGDGIVSSGRLDYKVKINGLDAGCDGERFRLIAIARKTTSRCDGDVDCTLVDWPYDFEAAAAALPNSEVKKAGPVTGGALALSGTVSFPSTALGSQTEIIALKIVRDDGVGGVTTFTIAFSGTVSFPSSALS